MKKHLMLYVSMLGLLLSASLYASSPAKAERKEVNVLPDWAFGGFVRPAGANPILTPNPEKSFIVRCVKHRLSERKVIFLILRLS